MAIKPRDRSKKPQGADFDAFVAEGVSPAPQPVAEPTASAPPQPEPEEAPTAPQSAASRTGSRPSAGRAASPRRRPGRHGTKAEPPAWVQRAASDKKTEAQPLRYNRAQAELLAYAKEVEGRDYSKILADLIWPVLEERYGGEVPLPPPGTSPLV